MTRSPYSRVPSGLPFHVSTDAPIFYLKGGCRGDLDQVEIILILKITGCPGKRFRVLIVNREMAPEGHRHAIQSPVVQHGLHAVAMGQLWVGHDSTYLLTSEYVQNRFAKKFQSNTTPTAIAREML